MTPTPTDILIHTPPWVWLLLGVLTWLGLSQWRERSVSLPRAAAMPAVMLLLGLHSTLGLARQGPPWLLPAWGLALAIAAAWMAKGDAGARGARWSADSRAFVLPGSPWPLMLILSIFLLKYAAAVAIILRPALALDTRFTATLVIAFGALSGLFAGRAIALWRLAGRKA